MNAWELQRQRGHVAVLSLHRQELEDRDAERFLLAVRRCLEDPDVLEIDVRSDCRSGSGPALSGLLAALDMTVQPFGKRLFVGRDPSEKDQAHTSIARRDTSCERAVSLSS